MVDPISRFAFRFSAIGLALAVACSSDSDPAPDPTQGDACECQILPWSREAGGSPSGVHDGERCECGLEHRPDQTAFDACWQETTACEGSRIQWVERGSWGPAGPGTPCLLQALADRTPGSYEHETQDTFSNGGGTGRHRLVVSDDGSVLYSTTQTAGLFDGQRDLAERLHHPVLRCTLAPPEYFDGCIAALAAGGLDAGDCAFALDRISDWFAGCAGASPVCE
jgi:hypothetical protein